MTNLGNLLNLLFYRFQFRPGNILRVSSDGSSFVTYIGCDAMSIDFDNDDMLFVAWSMNGNPAAKFGFIDIDGVSSEEDGSISFTADGHTFNMCFIAEGGAA